LGSPRSPAQDLAIGRARSLVGLGRSVWSPFPPVATGFNFTASADLRDKLDRLEARRFAKTNAPRKNRYLADIDYGRQPMAKHRGPGTGEPLTAGRTGAVRRCADRGV
jgi:hypothetical protein